jgi:hypothetical protein
MDNTTLSPTLFDGVLKRYEAGDEAERQALQPAIDARNHGLALDAALYGTDQWDTVSSVRQQHVRNWMAEQARGGVA